MTRDEAVAYLQECKNQEFANESTDWELVEAIDAILRELVLR